MKPTLTWSLSCSLLLLAACTFEHSAHPDACSTSRDCPSGRSCYHGFCVIPGGGAGSGVVMSCQNGAAAEACYEGPEGTKGVGACQAGQRFCASGMMTKCFEQVLPTTEICNGKDDDCNGTVDDIAEQSCEMTVALPCGSAGKLICRDGAPSCELVNGTSAETCNGKDDDCDGKIDELPSVPCFPPGKQGCALDAMGTLRCQGVCVTGMSACNGGVPSCAGAVVETAEECEGAGATAYDQDCDGQVDEQCPCSGSASRKCYGGPKDTQAGGACGLGTQDCGGDGTWQACGGQDLPTAETCTNPNKDDDCNGIVDDIPALGQPCTDDSKLGECRQGSLQCETGVPAPVCIGASKKDELCDALDQDCDGNPVNTFDLNSTERCGSCDTKCASGESCCSGKCESQAELDVDDANCGACGAACSFGRYCCQGTCLSLNDSFTKAACDCPMNCGAKACCGMMCFDLNNDDMNCGACGLKCDKGNHCMGGQCQ